MQVEIAALIISIASALAAIAAAIAAMIQARASVKAAEEARKSQASSAASKTEAAASSRQMTEMLERLARAQEQVAESQAPKAHFGWTYQRGHGDMVLIMNDGNVTVYDVAAEGGQGVHADEESTAARLIPGDYVAIGVMPSGYGPTRREVTMTWRYSPDGDQQSATVAVRPNR